MHPPFLYNTPTQGLRNEAHTITYIAKSHSPTISFLKISCTSYTHTDKYEQALVFFYVG